MCLEDIRLQRETTSGETIVPVGQTAVRLIGASELRTAILVSCPTTGFITLSFNPAVVSGQGIILNALGSPLVLDLIKHGAMVKKALYAIHSATTVNVGIWESSLEKT